MLDLSQLAKLTEELEKAVLVKDFDEIQRLCLEHNDFIFSLKPEKKNSVNNQKLKTFIEIHHSAIQLVQDTHRIMQSQLFQSIKARKSVSKYKGVKHAK
ncbi:hypothetical protein M3I01_013210 [Marinomonas sp. RSW2]|uniref:Flagellar protein FliT n=1 Tax=Marinomonas maritima TaxID=2940935 RepID=A0ABT5WGR4_9GAMM|nr:hypothetical protein [Marinomonas maritima]MDE8603857.1 hypothetical protein [Marinomonas maritima]